MVVANPEQPRRLRELIRKGSWRLSFRRSKRSVVVETNDECSSPRSHNSKRVQFAPPSDLELEFPAEQDALSDQERTRYWFQNTDFTRFEKDRVLTSFGYQSSRRIGGTNFDGNEHSIRGLELLLDARLSKRIGLDKKEMYRVLKEEQERQKKEDSFPDLSRFRSLSLRFTKASKQRALSLAHEDARDCTPKPRNQMVEVLTRFRRKPNTTGRGMERRRSIA